VIVECGPATGTLTDARRTYAFKGGYCERQPQNNFQVFIGDVSTARGNDGQPYFFLTADTRTHRGSIGVSFGGKVIVPASTVDLTGSLLHGAFAGKNANTGAAFSGSWNCHGVMYVGPN
jgi:hypothetical protein